MKQSGFTLVELAIVITIIGLLIGGVLKGQELLENARLTSVSNNIKSYEAALTTFRDLYKGKPGDLLTARDFITGCTAANNCVNGNGDGNVGVVDSPSTAINSEETQFWKQLALANLINGIDTTASTIEYGRSHPANAMGGGYVVASQTSVANTDGQGNFTGRFVMNWYKGWVFDTNGWPAKPFQAWQLDLKMDDGKPFTGVVRAGSVPLNDGPCERSASGEINNYNPGNNTGTCEWHYVFEQ